MTKKQEQKKAEAEKPKYISVVELTPVKNKAVMVAAAKLLELAASGDNQLFDVAQVLLSFKSDAVIMKLDEARECVNRALREVRGATQTNK